MTLTDRDRRIMLILIPIVIVIAYWFLLLSPKRSDLSTARSEQHSAEQARDQAVAQANQLEHAKATFAADYATVVRLGKAIPAVVDSPSLLVQLDRASHGTHIDFDSVTFGTRAAATIPVLQTQPASQPGGNAAAGGAPAQTGPGTAVESAGNAVNSGNAASTNVNQASGGTDTTTSTAPTTSTATTAGTPTTPATLDSVPLTFSFKGTYFDLADFFHRVKRFVYVANNNIFVRGRLMTIDTLSFAPNTGSGPNPPPRGSLLATVGMTIYLSPADQGVTAGATAQGPAGATTTTTTPAGSQTSSVPLATTAGVR
jgi:Tfp pilus assembly protein PilO